MKLPSFKINLSNAIKADTLRNISRILETGMFASHEYVQKCADQINDIIGTDPGWEDRIQMFSSGSSALEACAFALREKHSLGRVLVPANTFVATALAFERVGFDVEFYRNGIFETNFEIPLDAVGLVIVDLGGWIPQDIVYLVAKARKMGLWVCEDACQAFGSELVGIFAGTFGDLGTYSFVATKTFTGGEGGAVVVNDPEYLHSIESYRDFGKTERWVSFHPDRGWNCRMNEFGAAVLSAQLDRFEEIMGCRAGTGMLYEDALSDVPDLKFPRMPAIPHRFNGYKIIAFLDAAIDMDRLVENCGQRGVKFQGSVYTWILPEQPIYQDKKTIAGHWRYDWKRMVCLPSWYGITGEQIRYVARVIREEIERLT